MQSICLRRTRPLMLVGFACFVLALAGCKDRDESIGGGLLPTPGVRFTDSLGLRHETVRLEATGSANPNFFIFGQLADPLFGYLQAQTYSEFLLNETSVQFGEQLSLDSLVLHTTVATNYGNAGAPHELQVYEVLEAMELGTGYTTQSEVAVGDTPVGTKFLDFAEGDTVLTLKVRLSDELGRKILFADTATALTNDEEFTKLFKGLMLRTAQTDTSGRGVVWSAPLLAEGNYLRLHYKTYDDGVDSIIARQYDLRVTPEAAGFNRVVRSGTTGTLLAQLLDAPATAQTALLAQAGDPVGIRGEVDLSALDTLGPIAINQATLILPIDTARSPADEAGDFRPPTILRAYENTPGGTPDLDKDILNPEASTYNAGPQTHRLDITGYIRDLYEGRIQNTGYTILPLAKSLRGQSVSRIVFEGPAGGGRQPSLEIFYTNSPRD